MIKAKEGFILQKMLDAYMIIAVGEGAREFQGIIQTNETGAFYWEMIEKGTTEEALVQAAMERFEDLEEPVAKRDIQEFLESISPAIVLSEIKEDESMKYEKADVTVIDVSEDVITGSYECTTQGSSYAGCDTAGSQMSASCNSGNHVEKGQCNTNGHLHAVGN